jgi:surface antigen
MILARHHKRKYQNRISRTLIVLAGVGLLGVFAPAALAVDYDAQINALRNQIDQNKNSANQKRAEGNTLQAKVSALNAEISAAQNALNLTRTEISKTQAEIERQTAELAEQVENLKQNLKTMYKDRDVTPIEVLASSENLSDFVGKQEYMQNLKDKIESNIASITQLKADLETKKTNLTQKADQEKAQVANIASKRSEQQSLLAETRGEEAAYQNMVKQNEAQLASVFAARAEAIRRMTSAGGSYRAGGQCGGGYPNVWCNAAQDSLVDDYGYYNRECVSYAAWKRDTMGRMVPRYWGNANQWWARGSAGVTPAHGDIVAWPDGPWGHVAIVESNNGDSLTISEYNYSPRGGYSTRTIPYGQLGNVRYIK